ncbi:hypothetical protein G4B88_029086, partial [Cannabis sativa]
CGNGNEVYQEPKPLAEASPATSFIWPPYSQIIILLTFSSFTFFATQTKPLLNLLPRSPLIALVYTLHLSILMNLALILSSSSSISKASSIPGWSNLIAEYMEEVLTNPKAGFYISRDVFEAQGDFITSSEVSQMFGEIICLFEIHSCLLVHLSNENGWHLVMCLWEQMGQPKKVNLVELGSGRETLMVDLLRV